MKFTLPKDTFPTVRLSQEHQDALIEETDTVVKEIIAANDAFLADGSVLRDRQWRHVRSKEGLQVFRLRQKPSASSKADQQTKESSAPVIQSPSWSGNDSFSRFHGSMASADDGRQTSLSSSCGIAEDSIMERMRPPDVNLMALHGTLDGSLDDCMFGCFASTDEAWKLRSSHINDRLDDSRIVAKIRGPTQFDPFRFLAVKWFAKEHPVVLTGIVQQRDFLILEASGLSRDSKGEKVGYFVMHSVKLREVPELSHLGIVRGVMSFCYIFRQGRPGKVEVYTRGFFDSRGELPGRISVTIAADAAICCAGVVDYAYVKKLRWLVNHKGRLIATQHRSGHEDRCEACDKSFAKFPLMAVGSSTTTSGSGTCRICHRVVCSKCSVDKKVTVDVSDSGAVQQRPFRFCMHCLLQAKELSVWEMALSDLASPSSVPATPHARSAPTPRKAASLPRNGRSQSTYHYASTPANEREAMTSSFSRARSSDQVSASATGSGLVPVDSRATSLPRTANERFQDWSPRASNELRRDPVSTRGVRFTDRYR